MNMKTCESLVRNERQCSMGRKRHFEIDIVISPSVYLSSSGKLVTVKGVVSVEREPKDTSRSISGKKVNLPTFFEHSAACMSGLIPRAGEYCSEEEESFTVLNTPVTDQRIRNHLPRLIVFYFQT